MSNFFKIRLAATLAAFALCTTLIYAQGSASGYLYVYPSEPSAYPNQQGGVSNPALQSILDNYQVVSYVKSFPGAVSQLLQNAYEIHCNGDVNALKAELEGVGLFSLIELTGYYELATCPTTCSNPLTVNDPNAGYQFDITQAGCAWTVTQGSPDIVVGVADAFFDLNDDDLNDGQIISQWGTNIAMNPHGTLVAGMIVATPNNANGTAGLAPNIKVAAYSVNTSGSSGNPWPGIWQAYLDGRRIINVSWTGTGALPSTPPLTKLEAIHEMVDNGTLLVVAAGNSDPGNTTKHDEYADIPGVVMVSSVSSDGSVHEWVDYNEHVDLCAPGNGVGSLVHGTGWGTSYAAPAVSAAAGLILSVNNCLAPAEIENILKASACPMLPNPQVDPSWVGAGSLNMYQAILIAQGRSGTLLQSETWDDVTYAPSDVIVPIGVTLTINGTVKFSEGAGLIIQPGGRVNLHGTLTSSCMGPWDGVVVEGIFDESQYTSGKHGRLYTYDDAVIENAITAVELLDGGIIYGKGTTLRNNGTGVKYDPYSNFWPFPAPPGWLDQPQNHFGSLSNCTFLWNDDFKDASPVGSGVDMLEVRGINISGCSFVNERTIKNPTSNADYGYGVKATDAQFRVVSLGIGNTYPPSSYDHTDFGGLGYGVYVGTGQSGTQGTQNPSDDFVNVPYTVQQATFTECIYGIHNRFVSQGAIVGNDFIMGTLPPAGSLSGNTPFTTIQVGVFIENGANGFELQENDFTKVEDNVEYAYGTYCENLGWFNNEVRKNNYTNVDAGNLADENNAITTPNRGLYYLCNTNITQEYDFYFFDDSDIRFDQGELITGSSANFRAAGNTFTKANPPFGDFENNGPQVRYYHDGLSEKPMYHFGLAFSDVDPNTCESDYCLPPCREQIEWLSMKSEYATNKNLYSAAVADMQAAQASGDTTTASQKSNLAAGYRLRMDELSNTLSLHMAFDTTTYSLDSMRVWWLKMESPVSDMVVARDYLAKEQNTEAFAIIDDIPTKYTLSTAESSDLADYRSIMQIMQGETAHSVSESKVQQLLHYADNGHGISSAWAKNILTVKGYHFPPEPNALPGAGERNQTKVNPSISKLEVYAVTPNPAKDQVRFSRSDGQSSSVSITVTDATGRVLWRSPRNANSASTVWQTGDTQSGIYFYTIQDANGLTQSGRIVIAK